MSAETLISVDSYLDGGKPSESVLVPKLLEGLSGVTITQVSCGDLFAAVLTGRLLSSIKDIQINRHSLPFTYRI